MLVQECHNIYFLVIKVITTSVVVKCMAKSKSKNGAALRDFDFAVEGSG
jgi:hypothetical protein